MTEEKQVTLTQAEESMEAAPILPLSIGPVTAPERNQAVDVLRGFAVLGILGMNIYAFSMPFSAYFNPLLYGGTDTRNLGTWIFTHLFFDQKFYTIFSMLFGAGVILMATRAEEKGLKFGKVYYRRLLWLIMIGLLHSYLIWSGDILYTYGVCGLLLYPLRRLSAKTLIIVGIVFMLVALPISSGFGFLFGWMRSTAQTAEQVLAEGGTPTPKQAAMLKQWAEMETNFTPSQQEMERQVEIHQDGYWGIVAFRVPILFWMQTFSLLFGLLWRIGGIMMIGMGLMKLGVFTAGRSARFYRWCVFLGYGIGLPLAALSAWDLFSHSFDFIHIQLIGGYFNFFGAVIVAIGHVGVVMLICKRGVLEKIRGVLSAVGRMAFTNYLMQSVICTFIFYGYGLGLFGKVPRFYQMAFVIGIWALQILYSPIWLKYYRFGPMEWVWRSLTYGKLQPMRRLPENRA